MTAGKPSSLVPKLRFPEFQRAGDWKRDQIGNFASARSTLKCNT